MSAPSNAVPSGTLPPKLCISCGFPLDPDLVRREPDQPDHPSCDPAHRRPPMKIKARYKLNLNLTNPWRMDSDRRRY